MSGPLPLDPAGTVRLAFERARGQAPPPPETALLEAAALQHDLPRDAIHLAEALLRDEPDLVDEDRADLILLAFAGLIDVRRGSTRTPLSPAHLASIYPTLSESRLRRLQSLAEREQPVRALGPKGPLLVEAGHLYLGRARRLEESGAAALGARLGPAPAPEGFLAALNEVVAQPATWQGRPIALSSEQAQALEGAAGSRLALITGGPGTGKTSVVLALLRTVVRLGVAPNQIAVAAPTGKAAQRLTRALSQGLSSLPAPLAEADQALLAALPQPQTLHRLLGYAPGQRRFLHHAHNPLPQRWLVVDESSMIGLELMEQLLVAMGPEARLILLGDADQLPSVEAGAVFRDLVEAARSVHRLTISYRMRADDPDGSRVLLAAQAIQAGAGAELYQERIRRRRTPSELELKGVELLHGPDPRRLRDGFLDRWLRQAAEETPNLSHLARRPYRFSAGRFREEDEAALRALLAHHERQQLLTITRSEAKPTGAGALNHSIHRRWLERAELPPSLRFGPGEPVIALRNDYQRGLYNGDLGVVVTVAVDREAAEPMAVFPIADGFIPHALSALGDQVELAHALTVHKAQGSEFERVALILPDEDLPLLTREILYTALTRAKRSATLVGDPDLLLVAAARRVERYSGLLERLPT